MVALAMILIIAAGFFTAKAMDNYFSKATFTCLPGQVIRGNNTLWNIADIYCSGNITDAAMYIMEENNIEGEDLNYLLPSTIIVIKGGN
jgi:hypothetical protein